MIRVSLRKPILIADVMTSEIVVDENSITAKVIRDARREALNLKMGVDESVDHLTCKICNLATHELESLDAKDYLKLVRTVEDYLGNSD